MSNEELIEKAKLRIRKTSSDKLDQDIEQLVNVALADLQRIGVHPTRLENISDPLLVEAVLLYVKANFGNPQNATELTESYNMMCVKIKGGGYHRNNVETAD